MIKAKIIGDHNCISDDNLPWGYEGKKFHYEINDGDIVEVNMNIKADAMEVLNTPEGMCYLCKHNGKYQYFPIKYLDIDFSVKDIDWEERLYEIAKDKLASIKADSKRTNSEIYHDVQLSLEYAKEMVYQLQRINNGSNS